MKLEEIEKTEVLYDVVVASKIGREKPKTDAFSAGMNLPYLKAKKVLDHTVGKYQSMILSNNPNVTVEWKEDGLGAILRDPDKGNDLFIYMREKRGK